MWSFARRWHPMARMSCNISIRWASCLCFGIVSAKVASDIVDTFLLANIQCTVAARQNHSDMRRRDERFVII